MILVRLHARSYKTTPAKVKKKKRKALRRFFHNLNHQADFWSRKSLHILNLSHLLSTLNKPTHARRNRTQNKRRETRKKSTAPLRWQLNRIWVKNGSVCVYVVCMSWGVLSFPSQPSNQGSVTELALTSGVVCHAWEWRCWWWWWW